MNLTGISLSLLLGFCSAAVRGGYGKDSRRLKNNSKDGSATTALRDGDCEICSRNNKDTKPNVIKIKYVSEGKNSYYQNSNKATCFEGTYPKSTIISVNDGVAFDVKDGDTITLNGKFGAETKFAIGGKGPCVFHTSCSVPLVAGDQIGPFLILGSDEKCDAGEKEEGECVVCDKSKKIRPDSLTIRYHTDGANSNYQTEEKASCRSGTYPDQTTITAAGQSFAVSDGDIFTLNKPGDRFDANTDFEWSNGDECFIHTSCSVPLVVGDRIGPFEIMGGNDCQIITTDKPTTLPSTTPSLAPSGTPSWMPSAAPSADPSVSPSDKPTIEGSQIPSSPPTQTPSKAPSSTPTNVPTIVPSASPSTTPSKSPSAIPSVTPSMIPSQAPSDSCLYAEVRTVGNTKVVDIAYNYEDKMPVASDWVGLYPCSDAARDPPFSVEPVIWAFTCYNRNCRNDPLAQGKGTFTFDDKTVPSFGSQGIYKNLEYIVEEQPGCYIPLLNRIEGDSAPPYYNICVGNEIEF